MGREGELLIGSVDLEPLKAGTVSLFVVDKVILIKIFSCLSDIVLVELLAVNGWKGAERVAVQAGAGWGKVSPPPHSVPHGPPSDITASFVSAHAELQLARRCLLLESRLCAPQPSSSLVLLVGSWFTPHVNPSGNRMVWQ